MITTTTVLPKKGNFIAVWIGVDEEINQSQLWWSGAFLLNGSGEGFTPEGKKDIQYLQSNPLVLYSKTPTSIHFCHSDHPKRTEGTENKTFCTARKDHKCKGCELVEEDGHKKIDLSQKPFVGSALEGGSKLKPQPYEDTTIALDEEEKEDDLVRIQKPDNLELHLAPMIKGLEPVNSFEELPIVRDEDIDCLSLDLSKRHDYYFLYQQKLKVWTSHSVLLGEALNYKNLEEEAQVGVRLGLQKPKLSPLKTKKEVRYVYSTREVLDQILEALRISTNPFIDKGSYVNNSTYIKIQENLNLTL